jgi:hypothetical protein
LKGPDGPNFFPKKLLGDLKSIIFKFFTWKILGKPGKAKNSKKNWEIGSVLEKGVIYPVITR